MARRKSPEEGRIAGLFATSEEGVEAAQRAFDIARTTLTNARTYGNEAHATAAGKLFMEAAESYANAMRTHARLVVDYATERSRG